MTTPLRVQLHVTKILDGDSSETKRALVINLFHFVVVFSFFFFEFLSFLVVFHHDDDHDCSHTSKVVNFFSLVFAFLLEYWIFYLIFYFLCLHFVLFLLFFMMMMIMTAPTRARSSGKKGNEQKPLQHFFSPTNLRSSSISVHFCCVLIVLFNVSFNCIFLYFSCFHLFIVL